MPFQGFSQKDLLSVVSSLLDALGLLSAFTIPLRNVLKKLWKPEGVEWDKKILENFAESMSLGEKNVHKSKTLKPQENTSASFLQILIST